MHKHWMHVMPEAILTVRYETLVTNFQQEARRILTHCGLEWQEAVTEFHKTQRTIHTASQSQV